MRTFHKLSGIYNNALEIAHTGDRAARAVLDSREFEQELIQAARREPIPVGAPILYTTVVKRHMIAAGDKADRHMLCRAILIREHLEQEHAVFHSLREYHDGGYEPCIEVWINSTPLGCQQLRYRLGLTRDKFMKICSRFLCSAAILCPHIHSLDPWEHVNPANNFSATPDSETVWAQMRRYAN